MDHPGYIQHVRRYAGHDGLLIDEALVTIRRQGQGVSLHSGGHKRRVRTQYRMAFGSGGGDGAEWRCGQLNVMVALTDVGAGDGGTMLIPGSHKSNLLNPAFSNTEPRPTGANGANGVPASHEEQPRSMRGVAGAEEIHMRAGDALLFVDCCAHGSAPRTVTEGERRFSLYRYGPSWGSSRYGYVPSRDLMCRLTPQRRRMLLPGGVEPLLPPSTDSGTAKL